MQHRRHQVFYGVGFYDTVRIDGYKNFPPPLLKTAIQGFPFTSISREADGADYIRKTLLRLLNVIPGVVPGAVIDADNLQFIRRIL